MPVKSLSQLRFMEALKHGDIKNPPLSKSQASEFIGSTSSFKNLPEKVGMSVPKPQHVQKVPRVAKTKIRLRR